MEVSSQPKLEKNLLTPEFSGELTLHKNSNDAQKPKESVVLKTRLAKL